MLNCLTLSFFGRCAFSDLVRSRTLYFLGPCPSSYLVRPWTLCVLGRCAFSDVVRYRTLCFLKPCPFSPRLARTLGDAPLPCGVCVGPATHMHVPCPWLSCVSASLALATSISHSERFSPEQLPCVWISCTANLLYADPHPVVCFAKQWSWRSCARSWGGWRIHFSVDAVQ